MTLHIPKDFWWHRIFGSAIIFWVRKLWSTWSRGGARWGILADRLAVCCFCFAYNTPIYELPLFTAQFTTLSVLFHDPYLCSELFTDPSPGLCGSGATLSSKLAHSSRLMWFSGKQTWVSPSSHSSHPSSCPTL